MAVTTLLGWMAREDPLATVALAVAILSGICGLLGIGLVIFDVRSGPPPPSAPSPSAPPIEPVQAGFLATGLVMADAARWVPAAILQLACVGELAIVDRRARDLRMSGVWDPSALWLEYTSDPGTVALVRSAGESGPRVIRALFGRTPQRGERVQLLRTGEVALRLDELNAHGLEECREAYTVAPSWGTPRRAGLIATFVAGAGGLAAIVLALSAEDSGVAGVGVGVLVGSVVAYAAGTIWRAPLPTESLEHLNLFGDRLRARADLMRGAIGKTDFTSLTEGERILPWAVLFDLDDPIDRLGALIEASGSAPTWYRTEEPATRLRFVSCINDLVARMHTPLEFYGPRTGF